MQAIWRLLLDEEFLEAYRHGIVITFADGITRRVFPRIFTYSADYPEKVLLATIRYLAKCPCPRCLVNKDALDKMGQVRDVQMRTENIRTYSVDKVNRAQHLIYNLAHPINGTYVDNLLKESSSVPTKVSLKLYLIH